MKYKTLLLLSIFIQVLYFARFSFFCTKFSDKFYFSYFNLHLRLETAINGDKGISLIFVKLFHNKFLGSFFDVVYHLFEYFNFNFLVNVLSFIGLFGLLYGLYFISQRFSLKINLGIYSLLFIPPLLEELFSFKLIFSIKVLLTVGFIWGISIYGLYKYLDTNNNKRIIYVSILILLSIWWLSIFGNEISNFCFLK
ncbi:hypothetical protein BH11PAT1_BH11PAT1_7320 [soil metagenome]